MKTHQYFFKSPLRRIKRRLTGCCLLIIFAGLLACGAFFGLSVLVIRLASAQPLPQNSYEVLLLIDNSNSMYEKEGIGSDPDLLRIEAARLFITYLGVDSSLTHRLGVIFFGGDAELVVPLTPLADDVRRAELAQLIANPPRKTWTNPQAALELAEKTFAIASSPTTGQALVLLTDGKPEWSATPTAQETEAAIVRLRDLAGRFAAKEIPLFIILLQNRATDADPEIEQVYVPLWQEMAEMTSPGRFYRARQDEELLDIYHDIVVTLTGRQTAGVVVQTQVQTKTVEEVIVEPGLAQVTFVVRKSDPAIQVEIVRPSQQIVSSVEAGVQHAGQAGHSLEEIWAISDPPPGQWQVRLNGQGRVTVWKDFYPAPATPTFTPTATPTPTLLPTATFTPTPSPTPTGTPTPTLTAVPTATAVPTVTALSASSPPTANSKPSWWLLGLPVIALVAGGGWFWLQQRQTRLLLTGTLRQVSVPALAGQTIPVRLDLDTLGRSEIELGPTSRAYLNLPDTPDQLTPSARLVARLDPEGQAEVALVPEPTAPGPEPVQVNDITLRTEWLLRDGDVLTLGAYRFKYENLRQRTGWQARVWGRK